MYKFILKSMPGISVLRQKDPIFAVKECMSTDELLNAVTPPCFRPSYATDPRQGTAKQNFVRPSSVVTPGSVTSPSPFTTSLAGNPILEPSVF